jgi:hypothetical protein
MQVDAPPEDNDNTEEDPYLIENPTLVSVKFNFVTLSNSIIVSIYIFICMYNQMDNGILLNRTVKAQ